MARWFVVRTSIGDRTVLGPYEEQDVTNMIVAGQLAWEDQVSRGGNDSWRPIVHVPEFSQAQSIPTATPQLPGYGPGQPGSYGPIAMAGQRTNVTAGILALLLGGCGAHKFYNGSWGWGIIYVCVGPLLALLSFGLLFFIYLIPGTVALIEGIMYLTDPAKYDANYNRTPPDPWKW